MKHIFYTMPVEQLKEVILNSKSFKNVFTILGLCPTGPQYKVLKRRIDELDINISHFIGRKDKVFSMAIPVEQYFAKDCNRSSSELGRKIRKLKLIEYRCKNCGNTGEWDSKPLSLQIDHVDGVKSNNLLSNLRWLCPNCHSQTPTYSGKKHKKHHFCPSCGKVYSGIGKICKSCQLISLKETKFQYPENEELKKMVWNMPIVKVAKTIGCSDVSLLKHLRRNNIESPGRGYWTKRN